MSQKKVRILYIRPYSIKNYGAEEQDLEAGIEIIKDFHNLVLFEIKVDLKRKKLFLPGNTIRLIDNLNFQDRVRYLLKKYLTFDHAMTQAYSFNNYKQIIQVIKTLGIDIVMTNTTSTVLFGAQPYAKHYFRSVSFEPIYNLKTIDSRFKSYFHLITKFVSIYNELRSDIILTISPRDEKYYNRITLFSRKNKIIVLPLRQFYRKPPPNKLRRFPKNIEVGFLGSTYNVLHNRKSFEFILESLSQDFLIRNNIKLNIYGRKIPVLDVPSNVIIHNWVENIDKIYQDNHCFLVPYFLSSGMQSKVFEPLVRGRILICDTRVLSDYPFEPFKHFIPARTKLEFCKAILWVNENYKDAAEIASNGERFANRIIGRDLILHKTRAIFNGTLDQIVDN
jgi:hypothetical protein